MSNRSYTPRISRGFVERRYEALIGPRLRRIRLERGLTQKELAAPGYTHAYVSMIEAGRRNPSRGALEHLAQRLGVDVEELTIGRPTDLGEKLRVRLQEARAALSNGLLDHAEKEFKLVSRLAKRYGLLRLAANAEEGRGLRLERLGAPELAMDCFQQAERLLLEEPPAARAEAVAGKARCLEPLGDVRYAINILEALLEGVAHQEVRDPDALVRLHSSLLDAYLDAGIYSRAAESAAELHRLAPRLTNPLPVSQMHMYVARLHMVQGDMEKAKRSLQGAEDAYRQLGFNTELGYVYLARGYVLSRQGELEEARGELEQAWTMFEATNDDKDLTRVLNELARIERLEGHTQDAAALLERSMVILGDGDAPILAWAHR